MNTSGETMEDGPLVESSQHKPVMSSSGDLITTAPVGVDRVWVIDAGGVRRKVWGVDAKEICELGGRLAEPEEKQ